MSFEQIFSAVTTIVRDDYSGYPDKEEWGIIEPYAAQITDIMDRDDFLDIVNHYLRQYKDGHLKLLDKRASKTNSTGIKVRRYNDTLVVTQASSESGFEVGDVILALDNRSIQETAVMKKDYFMSEVSERQDWNRVLQRSKTCLVERGDLQIPVRFKALAEESFQPNYTFAKVNETSVLLRLDDFNNQSAIHQLIEDHRHDFSSCQNLIIDVRQNAGGSDYSYFPLLDFIFPSEVSFLSLFPNEVMETRYSQLNCTLRLSLLREYAKEKLPEELQKGLNDEIERLERNSGKGFVSESDEDDYIIHGQPSPEHVYVLSDIYCGSSGDSFVRLVKHSDKVTVVGRNTKGVLDYSNVAFYDFDDDLRLMYPTTRLMKNGKILGIDGVGVAPDVFLKWTPRSLSHDEDLEYVLQCIQDKR